jgi:pimeloyl-ACP methyl ester carboxylesterase
MPFVPTIKDWAGALPSLLDTLELKNVSLLGQHTGGLVATEGALQIPERVNKLIAECRAECRARSPISHLTEFDVLI